MVRKPKSRGLSAEWWVRLVEFANTNPNEKVLPRKAANLLATIADYEPRGRPTIPEVQDFPERLQTYHPLILRLLKWLCSGCSESIDFDGDTPTQFLDRQAHGVRWALTRVEAMPNGQAPVLYHTVHYDSFLAAVCAHLVNAIDDLFWEQMPVGICQRSNCGRFFVRQRTGRKQKKYCSDLCR